jgi:hypothetical protein
MASVKTILLIVCFFSCLSLHAQNTEEPKVDTDRTGLLAAIGGFDYISAGLGFNKGALFRPSLRSGGYNFGTIFEYKPIQELHLRVYGNLYHGLTGLCLGASVVLATDFADSSAGVAPEIGVSFPGISVL